MKKFQKLCSLIATFFCVYAHAGTYTFTTDANTDTLLQSWCFAYNAQQGGAGLFVQPATPASITAANVKLCIRSLVQANANVIQGQTYSAAFTPSEFTQMN